MTKIERQIRSEIAKAVRHLGGSADLVATIEGKTKEQMYDAAEGLNADRELLALIGSWGDTKQTVKRVKPVIAGPVRDQQRRIVEHLHKTRRVAARRDIGAVAVAVPRQR